MQSPFSRKLAGKDVNHVRGALTSKSKRRQRRAGSAVANLTRLEALEPRQLLSASPGTTATVVADTSNYYPNSDTPGNVLTGVAFNESETIAPLNGNPTFPPAGSTVNLQTGTIGIFFTDEHALTLGVSQVTIKTSSGTTTTNYPVSPFPTLPNGTVAASVTNPQLGVPYTPPTTFSSLPVQPGTDASGRPVFPTLFVTDITGLAPSSVAAHAGDWQYGGTPIAPNAVYGTWKSATETIDETHSTPQIQFQVAQDPQQNKWDLGPGADPAPTSIQNQGYGAEVQWNLSSLNLQAGHSYRFYFMVHDGDQNQQGGDVGQAAFDLIAPGQPTVATHASTTNGGLVGSAQLTDSVTISGGNNPTGTVSFTVTQPDGTTIPVGLPVTISGDGTYNASASILATELGTYTFHASYSGDANNAAATDNGQNESITTVKPPKLTPVITTSASATSGGIVGSAMLSDSVTVSGGNNPTGTVTFTVTQPDGTTVLVGSPVMINGDGTYNASTSLLATEVGTYTFHASYSGDTNNNAAVDNGQNESVTTVKASPNISTNASSTGGGSGSAQLSDTVTVSGGDNPTGTVTFTLTQPDGTTVLVGSPVMINGDGTYKASATVLATQVGTYTFHASYSGDALNNGAVDNGQNESVTTAKASPNISTNASSTGGASGGAQLSDTVTVSGGDNPTGTVTFTLTQPDGTTVPVGSPVMINGDGTYKASATVLATQVGTYTFHASYSGDALNNGAVDNGQNESVTTVKASPNISTNASATGGGFVNSAQLSDTVTVSGGDNPTGTVTFTLTQPDGTTVPVGSPVTINGDGTYNASTSVLATEVGTYTFHASYSGDSLNNAAVDNGQNESLTTVKASPNISTNASATGGGFVNSAQLSDTVTVSGGDNPTGTVTFTLTQPDGTTVPVGSPVTINGDGTYNASTSVLATEVGTYTFHASYSGDSLNNGAVDNGQNESVIIASPPSTQVVVTKIADCTSIDAGQTAGFTVEIQNVGPNTATGLMLSDPLPAGFANDINWQIDTSGMGYGAGTEPVDFVITGAVGHQVLALAPSETSLAAGSSITVHITGLTSLNDVDPNLAPCTTTLINTATVSAANLPSNEQHVQATATVTLHSADVDITKTADQSQIVAGQMAGFTVTIYNQGCVDASCLTLNDLLPGGAANDIFWRLDPTQNSSEYFQIVGQIGDQHLELAAGVTTLQPGQLISVHVVGLTSINDCGTLNNTATVNASNEPSFEQNAQASASITVQGQANGSQSFYVQAAFEAALYRAPDQTSLASFVNALNNGMSPTTFAMTLTHSMEYYNDVVDQAYEHYLGRTADAAGVNYWSGLLAAGMTDEQLDAQFIGSSEYYQHAGGTDKAWVDEMYFDLLGRVPDAQGEAYWVDALANGASRSSVALGFAASAEREGDIVKDDYQAFLGRLPSQSEIDGWVNSFENGLTNEDVIAGFMASSEFFQDHS